MDESVQPAQEVRHIQREVEKYGGELLERERWLVLTKKDLLPDHEYEQRKQQLVSELGWEGPVFGISSITGEGTEELVKALMYRLETLLDPASHMAPEDDEDPYDPLKS